MPDARRRRPRDDGIPVTAAPHDPDADALHRLRLRLRAQLLSGPPARTAAEVIRRLLAVQAQDPRGARLAIRSRSVGVVAADVDRLLTNASAVISTLHRGTLHLVLAEDYWWLHPLTTPQLRTANARRLAQEQVGADEADRAERILIAQLSVHGPMTRAAVREPIAAAGIRVEGQALAHILLHATLNGAIVRGPMIGAQQALALTRDWLGPPPPVRDRADALGELARRYLAGHGPAAPADLARWAGISLGDARRAFAGAADSLRASDPPPLPPPRLLGAFDPSLLGWVSRAPIVGAHRGIVTNNGLFRPFAMVAGRAVATWGLRGTTVTLTELERIGADDRVALDADADAVVRFLSG